MAECACLACEAAAVDSCDNVKLTLAACNLERSACFSLYDICWEVFLQILFIDSDFSGTRE